MLIYHCVSCLNYELRHQWEVSSVVESYGDHMPDIILDVATLKGADNPLRYPQAEAAKRNYRVKLRYYPTDKETFAYRGMVRNEQIARAIEAKADWVYFSDCDRAYHPTYFSELCRHLKKLRRCNKLVAVRKRLCTDLDHTAQLIKDSHADGFHHVNAYYRASMLPLAWTRWYLLATGGMQVVRLARLKELGGYYANPNKRKRDQNMFTDGQRAHSDVYFRKRVGGSHMVTLPPSLHLEHSRDKEAGKHLEEQR